MSAPAKNIISYGTFDLLHIGHIKMLARLKALGSYLVVGVSTDEFNRAKGKSSIYSFEERCEIVSSLKFVDKVIPECSWQQKTQDIQEYKIDILGIGDDWRGRFDDLKSLCEVVYLQRTPNISSTDIKNTLSHIDQEKVSQIKSGLDSLLSIVNAIK